MGSGCGVTQSSDTLDPLNGWWWWWWWWVQQASEDPQLPTVQLFNQPRPGAGFLQQVRAVSGAGIPQPFHLFLRSARSLGGPRPSTQVDPRRLCVNSGDRHPFPDSANTSLFSASCLVASACSEHPCWNMGQDWVRKNANL